MAMRATMKNTVPMIPTSARRAAHLVAGAPGIDRAVPADCAAAIAEPPLYSRSDSSLPMWLADPLWHHCTTMRASTHRGIPLTLPLFPAATPGETSVIHLFWSLVRMLGTCYLPFSSWQVLRDRVQAVVLAYETGLIRPGA